MNALILYYSYGGNTHRIATQIQAALGCDAAEIFPVEPYTSDYNSVVEQGQREVEDGYEPEIRPLAKNPADYDTIILGTPVWWYTYAPAVKTVLSGMDWAGKTIYPYATNGGWLGHTFQDFEKACKGATVKTGLNVRFDEQTMRTSPAEIDCWIEQIKKENT